MERVSGSVYYLMAIATTAGFIALLWRHRHEEPLERARDSVLFALTAVVCGLLWPITGPMLVAVRGLGLVVKLAQRVGVNTRR